MGEMQSPVVGFVSQIERLTGKLTVPVSTNAVNNFEALKNLVFLLHQVKENVMIPLEEPK